ncbi:hypothetical protein KCU85_g176, partial [Aureobasidium melanogenum]
MDGILHHFKLATVDEGLMALVALTACAYEVTRFFLSNVTSNPQMIEHAAPEVFGRLLILTSSESRAPLMRDFLALVAFDCHPSVTEVGISVRQGGIGNAAPGLYFGTETRNFNSSDLSTRNKVLSLLIDQSRILNPLQESTSPLQDVCCELLLATNRLAGFLSRDSSSAYMQQGFHSQMTLQNSLQAVERTICYGGQYISAWSRHRVLGRVLPWICTTVLAFVKFDNALLMTKVPEHTMWCCHLRTRRLEIKASVRWSNDPSLVSKCHRSNTSNILSKDVGCKFVSTYSQDAPLCVASFLIMAAQRFSKRYLTSAVRFDSIATSASSLKAYIVLQVSTAPSSSWRNQYHCCNAYETQRQGDLEYAANPRKSEEYLQSSPCDLSSVDGSSVTRNNFDILDVAGLILPTTEAKRASCDIGRRPDSPSDIAAETEYHCPSLTWKGTLKLSRAIELGGSRVQLNPSVPGADRIGHGPSKATTLDLCGKAREPLIITPLSEVSQMVLYAPAAKQEAPAALAPSFQISSYSGFDEVNCPGTLTTLSESEACEGMCIMLIRGVAKGDRRWVKFIEADFVSASIILFIRLTSVCDIPVTGYRLHICTTANAISSLVIPALYGSARTMKLVMPFKKL